MTKLNLALCQVDTHLGDVDANIEKHLQQMEKAQILGRENLIHKGQIVSQTENEVQIMDSTTFNITILRKPKIHSFKEVEIKIVKINNQIFLYPKKK